MRRFRDREGRTWDVVLGRESWGSLLALFVPTGTGDAPVRQAPLRSAGYDEATQELNGLDEAALQALLEQSRIREEGET